MMKQYGRDISLLLLDIVMPGMDGFAVLEQMNHQKWIEDTPVIMISSENSVACIRKAYDMGVSDFINRPFDANVVIRRVYNTIKLYAKQQPSDHDPDRTDQGEGAEPQDHGWQF